MWIDWVQLLDGISRRKQLEIKAFFKRYFDDVYQALPSIWKINQKLQAKTGIVPEWHDCCIDSCMAFTGEFKDPINSKCTVCSKARFFPQRTRTGDFKPRKRWLYLPLIPRLQLKFKSDQARILSTYRARFDEKEPGDFTDVFDCNLYLNLRRQGLFNK